jgi:1D-myo-inositol-triphosphate 3-kinase
VAELFFVLYLQIIGSSLLIMYDEEVCKAWMIDFAKTIPVEGDITLDHRSPWAVGNHEDGYLSGLDNLIMVCVMFYAVCSVDHHSKGHAVGFIHCDFS